MFKPDREKAIKSKPPFTFEYLKPYLDWYKTEHVSITYGDYMYLKLQRRYGPSWWLIGSNYNEKLDKWEETSIGEIYDCDIPRLVEWASYETEYHSKHSILTSVSGFDTCLNAIDEFIKLMSKWEAKNEN